MPVTKACVDGCMKTRDRINWVASIPFILAHLGALILPFVVGVTWQWVALAVGLYLVRMFGITAGYHRYFSHRAFKTSRVFQFILAFVAQASAQKGVLWWAAHHRHHHRHSDDGEDIHSPTQRGFWWSHVGWMLSDSYSDTNEAAIPDLARYPELRWLNRHFWVPPLVGLIIVYAIGGLPWVVWGGLVSTVALWHGTFTINSLSHVFGSRRYLTKDTSRNNGLLALLTLGEGWHNNHHFHQNTANQGWFWWELDVTYLLLRVLAAFNVVWDLRVVSDATKYAFRDYTPAQVAAVRRPTPVEVPALTGRIAPRGASEFA
jgi:stearoyl-CoA desaturase (Delta-9 desaturase)